MAKVSSKRQSEVNELVSSYCDSFKAPADKLDVIRQGISSHAIIDLLKVTGATQTELAHILSLTEPTLRKYVKDGKNLSPGVSDRIVHLFELFQKGIDTFGSLDEFNKWLPCHNIGLNARPVDLLDSITGINMVIDELRRIDHGILA